MWPKLTPLTPEEEQQLAEAEADIERGLQAAQDMGDKVARMVEIAGKEQAFARLQQQDPKMTRTLLETLLKVGLKQLKPRSEEGLRLLFPEAFAHEN